MAAVIAGSSVAGANRRRAALSQATDQAHHLAVDPPQAGATVAGMAERGRHKTAAGARPEALGTWASMPGVLGRCRQPAVRGHNGATQAALTGIGGKRAVDGLPPR